MKYKICKYKNDFGEEWYQIKIKWWIFWYNYEVPNFYHNYFAFWEFVGDRFQTKESAQEIIDKLIENDKRSKIKLVCCE